MKRYIETLQADIYDVALIYYKKDEKPKIRLSYTAEQLIRSVGFLKAKNAEGYHIYGRPEGLKYILLDDIKHEKLLELAKLKPCLLIETSPRNYQAWLKLSFDPEDYQYSLDIGRELQQMLDADQGAVSPRQVGRLPGYTNRKQQYRNPDGKYPFVILRKYQNRESSFHPRGGRAKNLVGKGRKIELKRYSMSEVDFAIACQMIREGRSDFDIESRLLQNLSGRNKGRCYISTTIRKAREAIKR
ncbi:DNA-primase RepB domain-containing protein [Catalinimonas niigatensis]|uniref:DNA-primase RepB domain-containing protein n=1 Tax=Catalinimonas niigatensis TaxID=1397264 RepID=UPI00266700CB|nr:DNA-primase RepB domain-containing protein [Catalinimonas niigatensis]WPP47963.1 DNA-primase RepB domain-containing protein [Catalinimonas niigatensis]